MKVSDLIRQLQELPEDMTVVVECDFHNPELVPARRIVETRVVRSRFLGTDGYEFAAERTAEDLVLRIV